MAPFFRKRLSCFYCGRRSTQPQNGPIRQWECKECDAVNYLDENGEITDPPSFETSSATRFAQPLLPHGASQPQPDTTLFCSTCIKNQHLLTEALASYLPPPSDPKYATYEASYPTYRKNLEARYPQVCVKCEPRVRDRIRQAGYEAKSDHLRRMMEQSRSGKMKPRGWNWRSLLVCTGAMGYWSSIFGQLGWNITGAMTSKGSTWVDDGELPPSAIKSCIDQGLSRRQLDRYCSVALTPYAGLALVIGVVSLWWNPRLRDRVARRAGRLVGLEEYYKIQIFVLVARFVAWACLQDPSMSGLNPGVLPAVHMFMATFTIISVFISRRAVRFDTTPIVSWQESEEPLVPQNQVASPDPGRQLQSPPESQETPVPQRFPINNLAPQPTPSQVPYNPPTPPPDIMDDSDAMDWTPSQFSLQPNHSITRVTRQPTVPEPSPFHGQLPAAPNPPAWQARGAQSERVSTLPAETPKQNPFNRGPVHSTPNRNSSLGQQPQEPAFEMNLASPKFFPPQDFATDTELENLFNNAFTIDDEPPDVRNASSHQMTEVESRLIRTGPLPSVWSHIVKCILLSCSLLAWYFADQRSAESKHAEIVSLAVACLIGGFSLLESLKKPQTVRSMSDVIIPLLELIASAFLGGSIPRGPSNGIFFSKAGECLLSFMLAQEVLPLVWPQTSSLGASEEGIAAMTDALHSRPSTRGTNGDAECTNPPYSEGRSTAYTATPGHDVQHSPSPSPAFSVASSSQSSSVLSPFSSRNTGPSMNTPLRSQQFAPAARPNHSPMPSFIGFSLDDNGPQRSGTTGPAVQPSRRYPLRARRG